MKLTKSKLKEISSEVLQVEEEENETN